VRAGSIGRSFQAGDPAGNQRNGGFHLVVGRNGHKLKEYTGDDLQGGIRGSRRGELIGERASLIGLARNLTGMVGRPVIDKTGLTGRYDFKLEWPPDMLPSGKDALGEKMEASAPEFSGPSLFSAIQGQLGLRLEPQKGSVESFVIVSAEKPAAN
jgi:uncharacterized protein (TIGR03435 family)